MRLNPIQSLDPSSESNAAGEAGGNGPASPASKNAAAPAKYEFAHTEMGLGGGGCLSITPWIQSRLALSCSSGGHWRWPDEHLPGCCEERETLLNGWALVPAWLGPWAGGVRFNPWYLQFKGSQVEGGGVG